MAKLFLILSCVLGLDYQVKSQIIRTSLGLLNRPYPEAVIDPSRNYIDLPRVFDAARNYIELPLETSRNFINLPRIIEASRNFMQPQPIDAPCGIPVAPGIPAVTPRTTIVTDCTPSVCKNLADTISLMIVSNLLQNTKIGDQTAMQVGSPMLKEIMSSPGFISFPNPTTNFANPNFVAPNVSPNFFPQGLIAPGANQYLPNSVAPRLAAPNVIAPTSNAVSPNAPINNSALLSSLLKLLGGAV